MSDLYVIGGQQRRARSMREGTDPLWYKYHKGIILQVDRDSENVECRVEYVSPPEVCAEDEPAILFKSGTLEDGKLYICTQTEVLIYAVPDFNLITRLSLPCFNDVHHVRPTPDGTLLVAISGLDMVLEITLDGQPLREWSTAGDDPWTRFSQAVDYRRVASTKPHQSHPNFVFFIDDEIWVTRFEQQDAISLTDPRRRIPIDLGYVHDGLVKDGYVYFTTVNGRIVIANTRTLVIEEVIDLNEISPSEAMLGWCRGILIDGEDVWVGFSRLRLTKFRENVSWVRWGFRAYLPTRVARYDLVGKRCLQEINLQDHGLDSVFNIFQAQPIADSTRIWDAGLQRVPDTVER